MAKKFGKAFQTHLIACLCRSTYVMSRIHTILEDDMFDDPILGDIAAFSIRHFKETGELLSMPSLLEVLDGVSKKSIKSLWDDEISDESFVVEHVIEFARQKAVEKAVLEVADKIEKGEHDGVVDTIRDALMVGEDMTTIGTYLKADLDKRRTEYINPAIIPRIQTRLTHIDDCMDGGLQPGQLGCILGGPKAGKSFVLVNIGHGAAAGSDGVNVIHFTLEMSEREVIRRYDKRSAGSKVNAFLSKSPREFLSRLKKRHGRLLGGDVLVKGYSTRQATPSMIRSHVSYVKSLGFNPGLIIVDYADIMRPERRLGEVRHEQASIYEDLRAMGQDFDVPVWTASQANRGALDKELITMKDVAESHEKSMIVDVLVALCRTEEEKAKNIGRFFFAAIRGGEGGNIIEAVFDLKNSIIKTVDSRKPTFKKKRGRKMTEKEKEELHVKSVKRRIEKCK